MYKMSSSSSSSSLTSWARGEYFVLTVALPEKGEIICYRTCHTLIPTNKSDMSEGAKLLLDTADLTTSPYGAISPDGATSLDWALVWIA
jgi:hypothetical protein